MRLRVVALSAGLIAGLHAMPAGAVPGSRVHPATSTRLGIVVTESPAASRAGREVLERGGNAVDAAAATVFALGVARPQSCGLGGGGFAVYRSPDGKARAVDFRETAPTAFKPTTLAGPGLHKSYTGHLTVGVPGTVAGLERMLSAYGTTTFSQAIAPAERLARQGFRVPGSLSAAMGANAARLKLFPAAAAQYLHADGTPYKAGETLVQPDLAGSLRRLQRQGPAALYGGIIGRRIVRDMRAPRPQTNEPGLMQVRDLAGYQALVRPVLRGSYRGRTILAVPPPTSGGTTIIEMLNILSGYDLTAAGPSSLSTIDLVAGAQNLAWADRGAYVADPAFVRQPTARLVDPAYAATRRALLTPGVARTYPAGDVSATATPRRDGGEENPIGSTTQVSVIDAQGGAVALTCTVEQEFGSAVVAPGTGILLNNELTDFGDPGTANQPAAGKRPRSSMAPTIVVQDGKPVLVAGGAGGATIIMGVLHAIIGTIDFGRDLAQAVDAERWDTGGSKTLSVEDARVAPEVLGGLSAQGWALTRLGEYGPRPRVQLAGTDLATGRRVGVSDSRSDHAALAQRRAVPRLPVTPTPARAGS